MTWNMVTVETEPNWQQDDSGVYVVIHRIPGESRWVRVDLMDHRDEPIKSWQGPAEAVRKTMMQWFKAGMHAWHDISLEHASYIGSEIARAALDPDYVQS